MSQTLYRMSACGHLTMTDVQICRKASERGTCLCRINQSLRTIAKDKIGEEGVQVKKDDQYTVAVVGLGYVGLPLAGLFLSRGHTVYGIDLDDRKIKALQQGKSYLTDLTDGEVKSLFAQGRFHPGTSYDVIAGADVIILCVPTPLDATHNPDMSYVRSAARSALPYLKKGQLVILESSTYPGTTEEELKPLIESAGLQVGADVGLAFSPERIDPGQKQFQLHQIPKVVGGITPACTQRAKQVYGSVFDRVVVVSSAKAAEMTKLLENCQRFVNISFMNEMLMLCEEMKIDLWEVVAAASTKPYGFTAYYPGPGIGGHCIPVDPLYLLWKARTYSFDVKFIELAHEVNERMPDFVVRKVEKALASGRTTGQAKLLVLGVTYKKDVNDMRESTAIPIIEGLLAKGAQVDFYDPYIEQVKVGGRTLQRVPLTDQALQGHDAVLILTDHSTIDYQQVVDESPLVIDARNATGPVRKRGNVILL